MIDEPTFGAAGPAPTPDRTAKYEKPRVQKFGAFRDLTRSDEKGDRVDAFGDRRRTVAFLGLLSPTSNKSSPPAKV